MSVKEENGTFGINALEIYHTHVLSADVTKEEDGSISISETVSGSEEGIYQLHQEGDSPSDESDASVDLQSSNVTAFVTLLKALFGVSLLSSPRVLSETGLVLGTLVYSAIVLACTGSCWCLLQAREKVAPIGESQRPSISKMDSTESEAITYGDLGRKLLGTKPSVMINFLIVSLHICFGGGLVATAIHQVCIVLGWEQDSLNENGEEEIWLAGRALLAAIFFPFIAFLLQFRNLEQLFWVCLAGILVFLVGCVGTMFYSTILVDNDGDGSLWDIPSDAWEWKWNGIPTFVSSTLCAMEGINLALPIANLFYLGTINNVPIHHQHQHEHQHEHHHHRKSWLSRARSPIPVVLASVGFFGVITLLVAYFGYMSGLGGGYGNENDDNDDDSTQCVGVARCLSSNWLQTIHRLSLATALILTLPIILYPSLELLERWADERQRQLKTGKTQSDRTLSDSWNGFVWKNPSESLKRQLAIEEQLFGTEPFFPFLHRHWRYRIGHAAAVCLIAIVDRPWEKGLVLFKGIGLSIACFVLPVILFVQAHSLALVLAKPALAASLCGLMALGLVNFVLVILSVFTTHNFLPTEIHDDPLHHHHDSHSGSHSAD